MVYCCSVLDYNTLVKLSNPVRAEGFVHNSENDAQSILDDVQLTSSRQMERLQMFEGRWKFSKPRSLYVL